MFGRRQRGEPAFDKALEEGQQIADSDRASVEQAMEDLPTKPVPLGVSKQTAAVMALDDYPFITGWSAWSTSCSSSWASTPRSTSIRC